MPADDSGDLSLLALFENRAWPRVGLCVTATSSWSSSAKIDGVALTDEADVLVALVEPDAHRLHRAAAGRLGTMTVWMATGQGAADIKNRPRRVDVWSLHASVLRAGCSCGRPRALTGMIV